MDVTAFGSAAVGVIVGVVGAYVALRRDSREARGLAMTEAKDTIDLLRQQTDILKDHGEKREAEWRNLEQGCHRREEKRFEKRIGDLERDYRSLVLTVTTMGLWPTRRPARTTTPATAAAAAISWTRSIQTPRWSPRGANGCAGAQPHAARMRPAVHGSHGRPQLLS